MGVVTCGDWHLLASISLGDACYCCCCCIHPSICIFVHLCICRYPVFCHRRVSHAVCTLSSRYCYVCHVQQMYTKARPGMSFMQRPGYLPLSAWLTCSSDLAYSLDHPYNDPYYHHHIDSLFSLYHTSGRLNSTFLPNPKARQFQPPRLSLRNFRSSNWLLHLQCFSSAILRAALVLRHQARLFQISLQALLSSFLRDALNPTITSGLLFLIEPIHSETTKHGHRALSYPCVIGPWSRHALL